MTILRGLIVVLTVRGVETPILHRHYPFVNFVPVLGITHGTARNTVRIILSTATTDCKSEQPLPLNLLAVGASQFNPLRVMYDVSTAHLDTSDVV